MPATAERAAFVKEEYRSVTFKNEGVLLLYGKVARDTKDAPVVSYFDAVADAFVLDQERGAVLGTHARRFRVVVQDILTEDDLDMATEPPTARLIDDDLVADMDVAIVGIESVDFDLNRTTLVVWGTIGTIVDPIPDVLGVEAGIGQSGGAGVASGAGVAIKTAAGTAAGTGTASGAGVTIIEAAGSATGTGAASAVGVEAGIGAGDGAAAGAGVASGAGVAIVEGAGTAAGTGSASGAGVTIIEAAGSATGSGTASGSSGAENARITEDGDTRVTEDGDIRVTED